MPRITVLVDRDGQPYTSFGWPRTCEKALGFNYSNYSYFRNQHSQHTFKVQVSQRDYTNREITKVVFSLTPTKKGRPTP